MNLRIALIAGLAGLMLAGAARALEVSVTVQETAGIARTAEPVSGGIPLPEGVYKPGQVKLTLTDGGKPVPCQVTELVVGPKGFVRWVLLDCQLDLKPNETRTLTLTDERSDLPPRPVQSLKVTQTADAVTVDTGKAAFTISKTKPFGLFSDGKGENLFPVNPL